MSEVVRTFCTASAVYALYTKKNLFSMETDAENIFIFNLIENVEQQECLYNKMDAFYYNRSVKEKTWSAIAEICNKSAADCKHRWKLLRERFCKELKRIEAPSGSGLNYQEDWRFLEAMMFLKDYLAPRRTRDNWNDATVDDVSCQTSLTSPPPPPTPPPPKKAKIALDSLCTKFGETIGNTEKSTLSPPEHSTTDEAFMKTVVCLMKDLPVAIKDQFQADMFQELYLLRMEHRNGV